MTNDVTYPNRANLNDDGRDYTSLIIWRMNAGARARSRACFLPPPVPPVVAKPQQYKKTATRSSKRKGR
jgi:hypothetical protein